MPETEQQRATVHKHTTYTVHYNKRRFVVPIKPNEHEDILVRELPNGRAVVGYLVEDYDCDSPLEEGNGIGRILDRRGAFGETIRDVNAALGLVDDENRAGQPDPYAVLLDVYNHGGDVWGVAATRGGWPDEQFDVSYHAGVWVPDQSCRDHIEMKAAKEVFNVDLSSYVSDKGGVHCTRYAVVLPDGRKRRGARTIAAALRQARNLLQQPPSGEAFAKAARAEAVRCAQQAVDVYNKWLSGEHYGVCVCTYYRDGDNEAASCSDYYGLIGRDYATQSLQEDVNATVAQMQKETS